MYSVDGKDKVILLDEMPRMDVGASSPVVFSDGLTTIVSYYLLTLPRVLSEDRAFVKFSLCLAHSFGLPNDEAFDGHPLAARGLEPFGAYRIENSSWLRQLERMNEVHPNHTPDLFRRHTHYILAFKDWTFECIARSYTVSVVPGPLPSLSAEFERLWHEPKVQKADAPR